MTVAGEFTETSWQPLVLEGQYIRLEPLQPEHHDGLCDVIRDGDLDALKVTFVPHPGDVAAYIRTAQAAASAGTQLAFAAIDKATGRIAGCGRFKEISVPNRRVEIGDLFIGKTWQRTAVNTEVNLLMLAHAFETRQVNRVEYVTDTRNDASRAAITRLGATQEGILRKHTVMRDGYVRDTVMFSLIAEEWPAVKSGLQTRLAERFGSRPTVAKL